MVLTHAEIGDLYILLSDATPCIKQISLKMLHSLTMHVLRRKEYFRRRCQGALHSIVFALNNCKCNNGQRLMSLMPHATLP